MRRIGDLAEDIIAQSVEESSIFFGDHGGELGGRLEANGPSEEVVVIAGVGEFGGGVDKTAAALLAEPAAILRLDLPRGDDHQQPPEVVAVGQLRELPPGQPRAEAVEGAQRRIFFIAGGVSDGRTPAAAPRRSTIRAKSRDSLLRAIIH